MSARLHSSTARVAIGGLQHETNTFSPMPTTLADFEAGTSYVPMVAGEAMGATVAGANMAVSGAMAEAAQLGWDVVPTLFAGATPSGLVTEDAFEALAGLLLDRLAKAGPLDGVLLDLHGAMVCEHLDDGEGELLARIRSLIGPDVPIVAALDLHANVSDAMLEHADQLESYRTYPHVDMADTGARAARALDAILKTGTRPAKALRRGGFICGVAWQSTDLEPARSLYAELARRAPSLAGLSLNMGFPCADTPFTAPSILAYGDGAEAAADAIDARLAAAEPGFKGEALSPEAAVALAIEAAEGPIVLADAQDNPGAGGNGDTTALLRALLKANAADAALGALFDPAAAAAAHAAGEGSVLEIGVGGKSGVSGDTPVTGPWRVARLSQGNVRMRGSYYGDRHIAFGPSALLVRGGVRVVIVSAKAQMADREMFRFLGVEPETTAILAVKSSAHFRADFAPISRAIHIVAAPGPAPLDPAALPWRKLKDGMRLGALGPAFARETA